MIGRNASIGLRPIHAFRHLPMREHNLGTLAGLRLSVIPLAALGSLLIWAVCAGLGMQLLGLSFASAAIGSLFAVALHWLSELVHNLGHAWAAQRTGHPMTGVRFGTLALLGQSLYPADEPSLPGRVHIQRALGGPMASAMLTVLAGLLAQMAGRDGVFGGLAWFFLLENLLVFTLGAFAPLPGLDGGTILYWLRRMQ